MEEKEREGRRKKWGDKLKFNLVIVKLRLKLEEIKKWRDEDELTNVIFIIRVTSFSDTSISIIKMEAV